MKSDQGLPSPRDPVTGLEVSASQTVREVDWSELPLSCPPHDCSLWNGHPRIYLPIHKTGRERCPYCGTLYILREIDPAAAVPRMANLEIERCHGAALEHRLRQLASPGPDSQQRDSQSPVSPGQASP